MKTLLLSMVLTFNTYAVTRIECSVNDFNSSSDITVLVTESLSGSYNAEVVTKENDEVKTFAVYSDITKTNDEHIEFNHIVEELEDVKFFAPEIVFSLKETAFPYFSLVAKKLNRDSIQTIQTHELTCSILNQ